MACFFAATSFIMKPRNKTPQPGSQAAPAQRQARTNSLRVRVFSIIRPFVARFTRYREKEDEEGRSGWAGIEGFTFWRRVSFISSEYVVAAYQRSTRSGITRHWLLLPPNRRGTTVLLSVSERGSSLWCVNVHGDDRATGSLPCSSEVAAATTQECCSCHILAALRGQHTVNIKQHKS